MGQTSCLRRKFCVLAASRGPSYQKIKSRWGPLSSLFLLHHSLFQATLYCRFPGGFRIWYPYYLPFPIAHIINRAAARLPASFSTRPFPILPSSLAGCISPSSLRPSSPSQCKLLPQELLKTCRREALIHRQTSWSSAILWYVSHLREGTEQGADNV